MALVIFICSALIIGFSDVMISILFTPRFHSPLYMFTPLALTAAFFFLIQLVLSVFSISNPVSWLRERSPQFALFVASFLTFFFIGGSVGDSLAFSLPPERVIKLLITAFISLIFSFVLLIAVRKIKKDGKHKDLLVAAGYALPFVSLEMAVFSWVVVYNQIPVFSIKFIVAFLILIAASLITLLVMNRLKSGKIRIIAVIVLFLSVLGGYFVQPVSPHHEGNLSPVPNRDNAPRYVFLIVIDSLRADSVSSYNPQSDLTPNILEFAGHSLLYENVYAASSWTLPSMASMMTGMPPAVHQANRYHQRMTRQLPTLADYMKDNGYYTAAIGINPNLTKMTGVDPGFIYYDFYPKLSTGRSFGSKIRKHLFKYIPDEKLIDVSIDGIQLDFNSFIDTAAMTDLSIRFVQSNRDKPVFLWMHYFDPHVPYAPPPEWVKPKDGNMKPDPEIGYNFDRPDDIMSGGMYPTPDQRRWIRELYDGEVRYVDHHLGRFFKALKQMGIYDQSLIVVTSDHGEEFWEHGSYYHGHTLYNELLRVPLMIKPTGKNNPERISRSAGLRHLMPTLLDYCGIRLEKQKVYYPSLRVNAQNSPERPLIGSAVRYNQNRQAVYLNGYKFINSPQSGEQELYDLEDDPGETRSLHEEYPEKLNEAAGVLKRHFEQARRLVDIFKVDQSHKKEKKKIKRANINNLRTLGYF